MSRLALLECGSNSLKVHFRLEGANEIHTLKFPWRLGRDVYETGVLSSDTLNRAVRTVEELTRMGFPRRSLIAIATEGLRDARNQEDLLVQLLDELQLKVRIVSGREEASLLADGYLKQGRGIPAYLMDIGGGSVQLVNISAEKSVLRDSLPLGAIRLHCLGEEEGKPWNRAFVEDYIESQLETACLMQTPEIHATGGTVKAVTKIVGKKTVTRDEVDALLERVEKEGPPEKLKPARRKVFLPGLMGLSRILHRAEANTVSYISLTVGRIFLERLIDRVGKQAATKKKESLADQMRITNIRSRLM